MRCVFFISIISLLIFVSCNKKVAKYNPDFIGTWRTATIDDTVINATVRSEIVIEKKDGLFNNTCKDTCSERLCNCISYQSGIPVMNSSNTEIKIGSSSTYSLTVDQEPFQNADGIWEMKIENLTYFKE